MRAPFLSNRQLFEILDYRAFRKGTVRWCWYLLVVNPDADITADVWKEKTALRPVLPGNASLYSRPHLTVAYIRLPYFLGGRLIEALRSVCLHIAVSNIIVNGYRKFENGVIYLEPDNENFFHHLQLLIKRALRRDGVKFPGSVFPSRPHLTIVKELSQEKLECLWSGFENRFYCKSFPAKELVLLRDDGGRCEHLETFPFGNSRILSLDKLKIVQPKLF